MGFIWKWSKEWVIWSIAPESIIQGEVLNDWEDNIVEKTVKSFRTHLLPRFRPSEKKGPT